VTALIDAHQRVWALGFRDQGWITGQALAPPRRNFLSRTTGSVRFGRRRLSSAECDAFFSVRLLRYGFSGTATRI
jgi:hypothetical protein